MSSEPVDLGELAYLEWSEGGATASDQPTYGLRHPFEGPLGPATAGGLAEAGWRFAGYLVGDIEMTSSTPFEE